LASIQISDPNQGDEAGSFGLHVDLVFGEASITNEPTGRKKLADAPLELLGVMRIEACLVRLSLDGCETDQTKTHLGYIKPDDPRRSFSQEKYVKIENDKKGAFGLGLKVTTSSASGSISAEAARRRVSSTHVTDSYQRELSIQAVEAYGEDQWIVYDRESAVLGGKYIYSIEEPVCYISALSAHWLARISVVAYPSDIEITFPKRSSIGKKLAQTTRTHEKLVQIAMKRGLPRDEEEPTMVQFCSACVGSEG